jgi:hypothetical protein
MNSEQFLEKQYEISVIAGMNQRYHQSYATWWWRWDASAKATTAILAVIGAMLSVAATYPDHAPIIDTCGVAFASLAAVAAVVLNIVPFGTWEKEHRDLLSQWTDVRSDVEALLFEFSGKPSEHHVRELGKIDAKLHRLCGQEPSPYQYHLNECYKREISSRTPANAIT